MDAIKRIIAEKRPESISDYFLIHKRIESERAKRKIRADKTLKIAILSSFTTTGIKEVLNVKCCDLNIIPEFYVAPYNQYAQEILDKNSPLYKFKPELMILFIDTMSLFGEVYFSPYRFSDEERKKIADEKCDILTVLINTLSENASGKIIVHNLEVPICSPLGILENKQNLGFFEMVKRLNNALAGSYRNDNTVWVFDYDSFCSKHGKKRICDRKMYYLGDIKLGFDFIPALSEEYIGFIKPIMSLTKKCIVFDLDNTLWGGIVGEDGLEGIKLGPTPEGRPFLEFQKYILNLFERGIMLAINSSNNPDDALQVLRKHPHMVLKERHFSSIQINWNDKISNIKAIAQDLNIGLDSLVFVDDDKLTREMVKDALPEVLVVELPEDPSLYLTTLMEITDFNTLRITEEDKKKGKIYVEQRKRNEYKKIATDITQYLKDLETTATIETVNPFTIPRISQLTQKTNQFNMTTRRYSEEDIRKFAKDDNCITASLKVKDRFGDSGIVGAAIVKKENDNWHIDTFLLSCRIIGRKIEEALLAYILDEARKEKATAVIGEFIPTKKNVPAKDFYKNNRFKTAEKIGKREIWRFDVADDYKSPDFIKVITKQ